MDEPDHEPRPWWPVLRVRALDNLDDVDDLAEFERRLMEAVGDGAFEIIGVRRALGDDDDVADFGRKPD